MNVVILNGSPRSNGNTKALVDACVAGALSAGHRVKVLDVARMDIAGCRGCEYCHTRGDGTCVQNDDMHEVIAALKDAEALVLASPIYYFTLTGQLQSCIHRTYAIGILPSIQKTALILTSGSDGVYGPSIEQYRMIFQDWMNAETVGIVTAYGSQNKSAAKKEEARALGASL